MTDDEADVLKDRLYKLVYDAAAIEEEQNEIRRLLLEESLRRLVAEPDEENDLPFGPEDREHLVYTDHPCSNKRNAMGWCCTLWEDCLFCTWSSRAV